MHTCWNVYLHLYLRTRNEMLNIWMQFNISFTHVTTRASHVHILVPSISKHLSNQRSCYTPPPLLGRHVRVNYINDCPREVFTTSAIVLHSLDYPAPFFLSRTPCHRFLLCDINCERSVRQEPLHPLPLIASHSVV